MVVVLARDGAWCMVQDALYYEISDTHLTKASCERASQVMCTYIDNTIVAAHPHYCPCC
jgi:hypothetical protein